MHVMHLRWNEGTTKNFLVVPSLVAKQPSLACTILEYECKAPLLSLTVNKDNFVLLSFLRLALGWCFSSLKRKALHRIG